MTTRLAVDREHTTKGIIMDEFSNDLSHLRRRENLVMEINAMGNRYDRGSVNSLEIEQEKNKEFNLEDRHLMLEIPSEFQNK